MDIVAEFIVIIVAIGVIFVVTSRKGRRGADLHERRLRGMLETELYKLTPRQAATIDLPPKPVAAPVRWRPPKRLWVGALLLAGSILIVLYLPPSRGHSRRVADRLAVRLGCPRTLPTVYGDSARGLTPVQRCGIIWAALGALPASGLAYLDAHRANLEHVMIVGMSDVLTLRGRGRFRMHPRESWRDRQRMVSVWVISVAIAGADYSGVYQIWVDKRSGVARRRLIGADRGN